MQETPRHGFKLPGGGTRHQPDLEETADISDLDDNFEQIDELLGAPSCTSTTRPANAADGDLAFETDTHRLIRKDETDWEVISGSIIAERQGTGAVAGTGFVDATLSGGYTDSAAFFEVGENAITVKKKGRVYVSGNTLWDNALTTGAVTADVTVSPVSNGNARNSVSPRPIRSSIPVVAGAAQSFGGYFDVEEGDVIRLGLRHTTAGSFNCQANLQLEFKRLR